MHPFLRLLTTVIFIPFRPNSLLSFWKSYTMPSDKDHLYIALYARGGAANMPGLEDTYHWALIVGPKNEKEAAAEEAAGGPPRGTRSHAREEVTVSGVPPVVHTVWTYEEKAITLYPTSMLLVRVLIAKVLDKNRVHTILRRIPIRSDTVGWNCVGWVQEAVEALIRDGKALGTSAKSWPAVRDIAMEYISRKKAAHRFDGQGTYDLTRTAAWDLLEAKETIPWSKRIMYQCQAIDLEITEIFPPDRVHLQFMWHRRDELVHLLLPKLVLWIHIPSTNILPV
ncbi:hypothetical protein F5Y12DRAFT_401581 [Xylaria sp. FL1777]|nr:hypothetical protein F5Y12DRAFT_401581 [Xylaria sp. FL1777]